MEKNFPFINIGFFDRLYDKLVLSVVRKLDSGNMFKFLMVLILHIKSFAFLLGVPVLFFIDAFNVHLRGDVGVLEILYFITGMPFAFFCASFKLVKRIFYELLNSFTFIPIQLPGNIIY